MSVGSRERIESMGFEEAARELTRATDRRDEIQRYVDENPNHQSGAVLLEWRELKEIIPSLTFNVNWEFQLDQLAVERGE